MCFQPRNSHSCVVFDCSLLRLLRGGKVGVPSLTRHAWEAFKLLCNSSLTSTFRKNLCALMVDFHRFCHARRSAVQHTCLKVGHKLRKVVPFSSVFSWQARHSIAVCNTCFIRSLQFFFFFFVCMSFVAYHLPFYQCFVRGRVYSCFPIFHSWAGKAPPPNMLLSACTGPNWYLCIFHHAT